MSVSPFTNPAGRAQEQASAYVRSIVELLGDRDPIAVQARLVGDLRAAVAGLKEDELRHPEAPGKWSIFDVVRHLADSEVAIGWRLRMVLAEDRPTITGFDQDSWSARLSAAYPDVRRMIEQIDVLRSGHVALLRSLTPDQWERVGLHTERGPESVALMARLYAGHDVVHLRQIARIRSGLARPAGG